MTTHTLAGAGSNEGASSILIPNAGVVLLWPYLPLYFERCELLRDGQFVDAAANHRAVRLVHLLASGQWVQDETSLPLAKVLCGVAPSAPLMLATDAPSEIELELSNSLLHAITQQWDALNNTSVDNLRGSFLMRPGRVAYRGPGAGWQLDVEPKAVDVLLRSLPWSIGTIALGWMREPLHVHWR